MKKMKNSILKSALVFFIMVIVSSCGGSDDNTQQPINENTWKLNDYNFARSTSTQTATTYTNGNPFTQVNVDSTISESNGSFKTCNVVFWFNTSTEGTYMAKSATTLSSFSTLKYMNIKCIVTNAAGLGASYESIDTDVSIIVTKVNNKFVITASQPLTLTKTYDNGLPNAPTTINFKCDNVR